MNFRPGIPRYLQIADAIRRDLRAEGERVASEHMLCARFNVSRPTIRQALDVLEQEGRIYRHAGRGTFSTPAHTDASAFSAGVLGAAAWRAGCASAAGAGRRSWSTLPLEVSGNASIVTSAAGSM